MSVATLLYTGKIECLVLKYLLANSELSIVDIHVERHHDLAGLKLITLKVTVQSKNMTGSHPGLQVELLGAHSRKY